MKTARGMKEMKRFLMLLLLLLLSLAWALPALAIEEEAVGGQDFRPLFDEHGAIMLLIDAESGAILYANYAAADFYGYEKAQLETMNIAQLNALSPDEIQTEMRQAAAEERNFFVFPHRLAEGEIRTVEVFSYPAQYGEGAALFSIVYDVSDRIYLEAQEKRLIQAIITAGGAVIAALLLLLILLAHKNRVLKNSREKIETLNALNQTFIDADERLIFLKDENFKYVFVNRAMEKFFQKPSKQIVGREDFELIDEDFARRRRAADLLVQEKRTFMTDEMFWNGRLYKATKFPVKMPGGGYGVGTYLRDITERRQQQLDYVLRQALELTESKYGYIFLYNDEKREFTLHSWTEGVLEHCSIINPGLVYQLDSVGIWGEAVRQNKPIIVNDFQQPNPMKKGYPLGHVVLKRFMTMPVNMDGKIVAVVGLANKERDYLPHDADEMLLLMGGAWNAVERREMQERLVYERNKYWQTLISIGDGVMVVDNQGRIEMLNTAGQRLTGWSLEDALGRDYREVFALSREEQGETIQDSIQAVFATGKLQELHDYVLLHNKNGGQCALEYSASPIREEAGHISGVVLVFRDITEKIAQHKKIEYLSFHDSLTGLYNRGFFEEELRRLDTERNLPLTIIMGDLDGLKLANDIFGHAFGDMLLIKAAQALKNGCRADDIIARWGGDEFVLLLPKTGVEEAAAIIERIKRDFSREQIQAIQGSISMGFSTKAEPQEDILQILNKAEENMYLAKTLERDQVRSNAIHAIIAALHQSSPREKGHSLRVARLCWRLGSFLGLPEEDQRKLKEAGYLHDIGKIVLDAQILNKDTFLLPREWKEMQKHPTVGYRILHSFDDTMYLAEAVLAHHERWDGAGYPRGLRGEEIPFLARIIAVAECYDWVLCQAHNQGENGQEEALRIIKEQAGIQFDPQIVQAFIRMMEEQKNEKESEE